MNFHKIMTSRRKELNLTQKDLAKRLNVSDKTISKWETGKSCPDLTLLKHLAKELSMDVSSLLEDNSPNTNTKSVSQNPIDLISVKKQALINSVITIFGYIFILCVIFLENQFAQVLFGVLGSLLLLSSILLFIARYFLFRTHILSNVILDSKKPAYAISLILTIILLAFPFTMFGFYASAPIHINTILGIVSIVFITISIGSIFLIQTIFKLICLHTKKDNINLLLSIVSLIIFLLILLQVVSTLLLPAMYLFLHLIVFRNQYTN